MLKRLIKYYLILFSCFNLFGQTKVNESGTYSYKSNTEVVMSSIKTELKLDAKTRHFSALTYFKGDLSKNKEMLKGKYFLSGDTIIFTFKYSQNVINPMFNCKDIDKESVPCFCSDTLIYKTSIITTKDKVIVLKKTK